MRLENMPRTSTFLQGVSSLRAWRCVVCWLLITRTRPRTDPQGQAHRSLTGSCSCQQAVASQETREKERERERTTNPLRACVRRGGDCCSCERGEREGERLSLRLRLSGSGSGSGGERGREGESSSSSLQVHQLDALPMPSFPRFRGGLIASSGPCSILQHTVWYDLCQPRCTQARPLRHDEKFAEQGTHCHMQTMKNLAIDITAAFRQIEHVRREVLHISADTWGLLQTRDAQVLMFLKLCW